MAEQIMTPEGARLFELARRIAAWAARASGDEQEPERPGFQVADEAIVLVPMRVRTWPVLGDYGEVFVCGDMVVRGEDVMQSLKDAGVEFRVPGMHAAEPTIIEGRDVLFQIERKAER